MDYKRLIDKNPTLIHEYTNQLGQKIEVYEHPLRGDEFPVIAVCKSLELAHNTGFYDIGDFFQDSDYNTVFYQGKGMCYTEYEGLKEVS